MHRFALRNAARARLQASSAKVCRRRSSFLLISLTFWRIYRPPQTSSLVVMPPRSQVSAQAIYQPASLALTNTRVAHHSPTRHVPRHSSCLRSFLHPRVPHLRNQRCWQCRGDRSRPQYVLCCHVTTATVVERFLQALVTVLLVFGG